MRNWNRCRCRSGRSAPRTPAREISHPRGSTRSSGTAPRPRPRRRSGPARARWCASHGPGTSAHRPARSAAATPPDEGRTTARNPPLPGPARRCADAGAVPLPSSHDRGELLRGRRRAGCAEPPPAERRTAPRSPAAGFDDASEAIRITHEAPLPLTRRRAPETRMGIKSRQHGVKPDPRLPRRGHDPRRQAPRGRRTARPPCRGGRSGTRPHA